MSVVPAPARVLDEMWRVLRPGGQMVLMNHFSAERGLRARTEAALEKSAGWLGWHPQFPYAAVGDWIAARKDAAILERRADCAVSAVHAAAGAEGRTAGESGEVA